MIPLRCAECHSHEHLFGATSECSVHGTIGADGHFDLADFEAPFGPDPASVECSEHIGAGIEFYVGGEWCVSIDCDDAWHEPPPPVFYGPSPRRSWACPTCGSQKRSIRNGVYRAVAGVAVRGDSREPGEDA